MKYSEDLEIYKTKNGNYHIDDVTYYLKICPKCKIYFLSVKKKGKNCSRSCAHSNKKVSEETKKKLSESHKGKKLSKGHKINIGKVNKGDKNSNWKGGVKNLNIPLFDTYAPQLEKYEEVRKTSKDYLEVKCTYCGKWFVPKQTNVGNRLKFINGYSTGEGRFYCSNECKINCPIFAQKKYEKSSKPASSREVQPELRKLVFQRDNWTCIKCSATTNLHCHHIEGILQNPIESADLDTCITVCKYCHKEIHKQKGCRYSDFRCKRY